MTDEGKSDLGLIKIHNNVIASIAYLAALEIDGISRICDDVRSRILNFIGKKTKSGAIDVRTRGESISVVVPLIVKYGYNIPEVALKVQERIKSAIEESTDVTPKDIIIKIKGVDR